MTLNSGFPGEVGPWPMFEDSEPFLHTARIVMDIEPGDARIEAQERDWERDEAEAAEEDYVNDPGRVDA